MRSSSSPIFWLEAVEALERDFLNEIDKFQSDELKAIINVLETAKGTLVAEFGPPKNGDFLVRHLKCKTLTLETYTYDGRIFEVWLHGGEGHSARIFSAPIDELFKDTARMALAFNNRGYSFAINGKIVSSYSQPE